ncbi:MAG: PAS domain S-box protein [Archaeoglobaceae archaeon]|nr:PAS domain S-box protein [Archaeoglobales archaeon]
MKITIIRRKEDLKDCDVAILEGENLELLKEAKKYSKFVVFFGEKAEKIEEIKKFEDFLQNYEIFKTIAERSPDPIVIFNAERILYTNPKALEYAKSEAKGIKRILDLVRPDYQSIALERMRRVLKGEKTEPAEYPCIMPDRREVWFETNSMLINFKGEPAILLILRDVTEKKIIEKKLEESGKKYKEFFDNSLDIIAVTDLNGHFIEVNKAFEIAFGYTNEEVKGRDFAEVLRLEKSVANEIFRSYNRAFRERRDLRGLVFEVKRKDGRRIIVEGNIRLLCEKEKIIGFVGNYRDVTDRIRLEKKLKESEERYRKIFEFSPVLIALVDEKGIFIEANRAMVKSVGLDPVGKSHYDLFTKEVAERRTKYVKEAIEKDKIIVFQDQRNGRFFFNQYIPLELEGKKHCLIISQELTELLRLNKFLRQIIEVGETLARFRDRKALIEKVETILSEYSARISNKPEEVYFRIGYKGENYGYLCVKFAGEEERKLLKTLADDLALAFKSIEDENKKKELYERLSENIRTIAYLVDKIRNPLAVVLAYAEIMIEDRKAKEKVVQQIDRIVEIMRELDTSWLKSEELAEKRII